MERELAELNNKLDEVHHMMVKGAPPEKTLRRMRQDIIKPTSKAGSQNNQPWTNTIYVMMSIFVFGKRRRCRNKDQSGQHLKFIEDDRPM